MGLDELGAVASFEFRRPAAMPVSEIGRLPRIPDPFARGRGKLAESLANNGPARDGSAPEKGDRRAPHPHVNSGGAWRRSTSWDSATGGSGCSRGLRGA